MKGYSAVDSESQLVFSYRLEPLEKEWKQNNNGEIRYKSLRPGSYLFKVRAVDRDLNYSAERCVRLDIVPEASADGAIAEVLSSMKDPLTPIIGTSAAIEQVRRQIREIASLDISVLILGQTGTGKGIVARTIHDWGLWAETPFIAVNCGAISSGLADSELFGHEKGAFTGAVKQKKGKFEIANGGTIFLDEIGELPLEIQTRLLHVLQDKVIERVGGTVQIPIEVRVIAATNRDLPQAIEDGSFRRDLFYRLNSFPIQLPNLAERLEDIPLLARHFVKKIRHPSEQDYT